MVSFLTIKAVQSGFFADSHIHYLYSLFTLFEYIFFASFFWLSIQNSSFKKKIIYISIAFVIFLIIFPLTVKIKRVDSIPIGVETIVILIFSFYFLYELLNKPTSQFIYSNYRFWIVTGMCLYLAGSFFFYILSEQLNKEDLKEYRFLSYLFYILKNIFFGIGLILFSRTNTEKSTINKTIPYLDIN